jgi:methyltransferase (TIGR00027 family)
MVTVADTAFSIAAVRAEEGDRADRLFVDPYAKLFAAAGAHAAEATQRYLDLPFFRDGIRLRTRFIDDAVRDGHDAGIRQLVLLGAGFDMRALRLPWVGRVFEIDTPEQMARKRAVLESAGIVLPSTDVYVPFDFEHDHFEARLSEHGYRAEEGTVFVWEGVIGYIDEAAIERSLRFMAKSERSRLVFTYGFASFEPDGAEARVLRAGFSKFTGFGLDQVWRRYFETEPHAAAWTSKVGVAVR